MSLLHSNLNKTKVTVRTETPEVTYLTTSADEARITVIANSCNFISSNADTTLQHIYYLGNTDTDVYIGVDNTDNGIIDNIAIFSQNCIEFNTDTIIQGSLLPKYNAQYTLGTPENKWHNLHARGSIYFGDVVIQYDSNKDELAFKNYSQEKIQTSQYTITTSNVIQTSNINIIFTYIPVSDTENTLIETEVIETSNVLITSNISLTSNSVVTIPEKVLPIKAKHLSIYNPDGSRALLQTSAHGTFLTSYSPQGNVISSINLTNFSTTSVAEDPDGSNLYFTDQRVIDVINTISSQSTSSILLTSNQISSSINTTSNIFASNISSIGDDALSQIDQYAAENNANVTTSTSNNQLYNDTYNYLQKDIKNTSNTLVSSILSNDDYMRYYLDQASNSLIQTLQETSNNTVTYLNNTDVDTSNYIKETWTSISANLTSTSNLIADILNIAYITNACNITDTSNIIKLSIDDASNSLETLLASTMTLISTNTDITSNNLFQQLTDTFLYLHSDLDISNSNMIDYVNENIKSLDIATTSFAKTIRDKINNLDLKDVSQTQSRKVIVDNLYDNDLTVSNLILDGDLLPEEDVKYDLGAPNSLWKDLYLSINTIYLNDVKISGNTDTGGLAVQNAATNKYADIITSKIVLKDTVTNTLVELKSSGNIVGVGTQTTSITKVYTTSSIVELPGASNLYYTPERVGAIANASNLAVSRYTDTMSNLISVTINNLTTDSIQNGTSNQFIVNGIYPGNLTIAGTLTVSNLEVIGASTTINTATYETEKMKIHTLAHDGPALTVIQDGSMLNVAEFYKGSTKVFSITNQGNIGIGNITPTERLDIDGNIKFSQSINNITVTELSYMSAVTSPIQTQLNDVNRDTSNYTSNIYVNFISLYVSTSNAVNNAMSTSNTNMISLFQNTSNNFASNLVNTSNNLANYYIRLSSNITSNLNANVSNIFNTAIPNVTNNILYPIITNNDTNHQAYFRSSSNNIQSNITNTSNALAEQIIRMATTGWLSASPNPSLAGTAIPGSNIYFNLGNIGIGTSMPSEKLDIVGNIKLTGLINNITTTELSYLSGTASNVQNQITDTSNNLVRYTNNTSNFFVSQLANMSNTISPIVTKLNININNYIRITSNAFQTDLRSTSNNLSAIINSYATGVNYISQWSNAGANIYYSSNVGVGTSNVASNNILEIADGDMNIGGGDIKRTIIVNSSAITEPYQLERWKDSDTYNNSDGNRFIYYNAGYVGIGKDPTVPLHVDTSNFSATSNVMFFDVNNVVKFQTGKVIPDVCAIFDSSIWCKSTIAAASDSRIKKNIEDIDDHTALDMIMAIEPKTYNYIDQNKGSTTVYGFLAQQIKQVIPHAVQLRKDVIPNIFAVAFATNDKLVFDSKVKVNSYGNFINGKMCIVYMSGQYDTVVITSIETETNAIIIDKIIDDVKVFVYGTEVSDFHTLDKSYIYTLNICATQILASQIDELEKEVSEIEKILNLS